MGGGRGDFFFFFFEKNLESLFPKGPATTKKMQAPRRDPRNDLGEGSAIGASPPRGRTAPAGALARRGARRPAREAGVGLRPASPRVLAQVHASSAPLEPAASARRARARTRRSAFRATPEGGARPLLRPLLGPGEARPGGGGGNGRGRRRGGLTGSPASASPVAGGGCWPSAGGAGRPGSARPASPPPAWLPGPCSDRPGPQKWALRFWKYSLQVSLQ